MKKLTFPKGVHTLKFPYMANLDAFKEMREEMKKVLKRYSLPKSAKTVGATMQLSLDLKNGRVNYELSDVYISKV